MAHGMISGSLGNKLCSLDVVEINGVVIICDPEREKYIIVDLKKYDSVLVVGSNAGLAVDKYSWVVSLLGIDIVMAGSDIEIGYFVRRVLDDA